MSQLYSAVALCNSAAAYTGAMRAPVVQRAASAQMMDVSGLKDQAKAVRAATSPPGPSAWLAGVRTRAERRCHCSTAFDRALPRYTLSYLVLSYSVTYLEGTHTTPASG